MSQPKQELAKIKKIPFQESSIETIDRAFNNWLDNTLNIFCSTVEGWEKVDIIWLTAERAFLTKRSKEATDLEGMVNLPLISIERVSVVKDPTKKGSAWGNVPAVGDEKGGSITIAREINQDKTSNFANADSKRKTGQINFPRQNKKIVYNTYSIPMPVYVEVTYNVIVRTLYQQQMNEILQPFLTQTGGINYFICKYEGHRYEGFIDQDFKLSNNLANTGENEKKYETTIPIKVLGHLIGMDKNQEQPNIVVRENAVAIRFNRERSIDGDVNEQSKDPKNQGFVGTMKINNE